MRAGAAPRSLAPPPSESRPICRETRTCSLSTSRPCGGLDASGAQTHPPISPPSSDRCGAYGGLCSSGCRSRGHSHALCTRLYSVVSGVAASPTLFTRCSEREERTARDRPPVHTTPALMLATLQVGHGPWPLRLWPFRYGRAARHIPPHTTHTHTHTHTPQQPPPHPPLTPPPLSPLCPGGGCVCVSVRLSRVLSRLNWLNRILAVCVGRWAGRVQSTPRAPA